MASVKTTSLPEESFLQSYQAQDGGYADCFVLEGGEPNAPILGDYIFAFFNSPIFRLERVLLKTFLSAPSSTADVEALAFGGGVRLASWQLEERAEDQILLAVKNTPVRTWLMVSPPSPEGGPARIYFGTALVPTERDKAGNPTIPAMYRRFIFFHRAYSKLLLWSAGLGLRNAKP